MSDAKFTSLVADRAVVELKDVTRLHGLPPVRALDQVRLSVRPGELLSIVGPSGSGKSTLLNILGTLDRPTSGQVLFEGRDVAGYSDRELSGLRARRIGFVFQQFHLEDGADAVDNVADGLLYSGIPRATRRRRAKETLALVGLGHRLDHRPQQMSGGERQRVAIARALVSRPALLLADEPTGNLDTRSAAGVVDLLRRLNHTGAAVVVITHDAELAAQMPRRVEVRDGQVLRDESQRSELRRSERE